MKYMKLCPKCGSKMEINTDSIVMHKCVCGYHEIPMPGTLGGSETWKEAQHENIIN